MSKKQRTREKLLDAAWQRLTRGDAAKLEEVGADAGVSRQSVYLHFGSRGGMLFALVQHIDEKNGLSARIAALDEVDDAVGRLEATLGLMAAYGSEIHGVAMALMQLASEDVEVRDALEDRMTHRRAALARVVARIARTGRLRKEWSQREVVDALWEAGAPSSYQHLVVERGWKPARFRDWLLWTARSFIRDAPETRASAGAGQS